MIRTIFFLVGFFLAVSGPVSQAQDHGITNRSETIQMVNGKPYYFHAVLQGQTLYSISRAYGVSIDDIIAENPDLESGLNFDQVVRIPADTEDRQPERKPKSPEDVKVEDGFIIHKVQRRETLFGISREYNISMEEILFHNPDARSGLQVNQVLRIPVVEEEDDAFLHYTVSAGETEFSLSRQFGISIEQLRSLNPAVAAEGLKEGQRIRLPAPETEKGHLSRIPPRNGYIFLPPETTEKPEDEIDPDCFDPELKDHYNIALLIPLFLEELEGHDTIAELPLDHRSFSFIEYYKGVMLALDSVKKQGGDFTLHVYDVSQDLSKARDVIRKPEFEDMDLIIGPFHRETLSFVAGYGLRNNIPVVSPLLDDNRQIRGFPNLFQATPSLEAQLQDLSQFVSRNYPDQNIFIVHNNQPGARELIAGFKDEIMREVYHIRRFNDSLNLARIDGYFFNGTLVGNRRTNVLVVNDSILQHRLPSDPALRPQQGPAWRPPPNVREVIYDSLKVEGIVEKMDKNRKNILITLISGEPFVSSYLRALSEKIDTFDISVFGIPQWQNYRSVEVDYLQNLNVHIFTPEFYDYQSAHIQDFVLRYRNLYGIEPGEYAFKGVQTAYFFFSALQNLGIDFSRCVNALDAPRYDQPFDFQRTMGSENGWENRHTNIFRYQDFRKKDVRTPVMTAKEIRKTEESPSGDQ